MQKDVDYIWVNSMLALLFLGVGVAILIPSQFFAFIILVVAVIIFLTIFSWFATREKK